MALFYVSTQTLSSGSGLLLSWDAASGARIQGKEYGEGKHLEYLKDTDSKVPTLFLLLAHWPKIVTWAHLDARGAGKCSLHWEAALEPEHSLLVIRKMPLLSSGHYKNIHVPPCFHTQHTFTSLLTRADPESHLVMVTSLQPIISEWCAVVLIQFRCGSSWHSNLWTKRTSYTSCPHITQPIFSGGAWPG